MMTQEFIPTVKSSRVSSTYIPQDTEIDLNPAKVMEFPRLVPEAAAPESHRWGIVLAGGNGVRLRELTRTRWGPDCPKQFCSLLSDRTLLDETRRRAERSVPAEHILYSLTREHKQFYLADLGDRPSQRIVQPFNRGTAPAILYALVRIAQADPEAIVTILPSDHYYSSESTFTESLESALLAAERRPRSVIVLGARADRPETDFGWIETGTAIDNHAELFRVVGFQEKPSEEDAEDLLQAGCLWNTFVMVGQVSAFLRMAWTRIPRLMDSLECMDVLTHPSGEVQIPASVYNKILPTDFAQQILAPAAETLLVLRLSGLTWNDLGSPDRVLATLLEKNGVLPAWAKAWPGFQPAPRVASASGGFRF